MQQQKFGGTWTEQKLTVLRKYLNAFTKALARQPFRTLYIDGFAGSGHREDPRDKALPLLSVDTFESNRDLLKLRRGSVQIALDISKPFDRYVLIEKKEANVRKLETLRADWPNRTIDILKGDANEEIVKVCSQLKSNDRGVLFLDPFGAQVDWATLEAVANTERIDVWILVPIAIAYNRMLPQSGSVPVEWEEKLNCCLGTGEWRHELYRTEHNLSLFGAEERIVREPMEKISKFYGKRLGQLFASVPSEAPRVLRDRRGRPLFELWFAISNRSDRAIALATRIANDILKSGV